MPGFWRTVPPPDKKFPGAIAEPSALNNTRLGSSELNVSTGFAAPPVKAEFLPAASVAATAMPPVVAGCPQICPTLL